MYYSSILMAYSNRVINIWLGFFNGHANMLPSLKCAPQGISVYIRDTRKYG